MGSQCFPQQGRDAKGVDVCAEAYNFIFSDAVNLFNFLKVASMEMVFVL